MAGKTSINCLSLTALGKVLVGYLPEPLPSFWWRGLTALLEREFQDLNLVNEEHQHISKAGCCVEGGAAVEDTYRRPSRPCNATMIMGLYGQLFREPKSGNSCICFQWTISTHFILNWGLCLCIVIFYWTVWKIKRMSLYHCIYNNNEPLNHWGEPTGSCTPIHLLPQLWVYKERWQGAWCGVCRLK